MIQPTRFYANVSHRIVLNVQRWSIQFSVFKITVEYVIVEYNTQTDILTLWEATAYSKVPGRTLKVSRVPLVTGD